MTLIGLVPASILSAYFGGELASSDLDRVLLLLLLLGGLMLLPFIFNGLSKRHKHLEARNKLP